MELETSNSINNSDRASYITTNETTPLQRDKVQDEGLRFILIIFAVVTIIITIALGVSISQEKKEVGLHSAVVSDEKVCSAVGKELFQSGGNAVDVAIAVTICLGVIFPHLTGIGGNGLILVYNQKLGKPLICLDSWTPETRGLPKLLLALHTVHNAFGKKPWKSLIEPSVKIARDGFTVTESLSQSNEQLTKDADENLKNWLLSLQKGKNASSLELAHALDILKEEGSDALYKGQLSLDLKQFLGMKIINNLKLNAEPCIESVVEGFHVITSGKGSGGPLFHETLSKTNITHNSSIQYLIDYFEGREEMNWPLPSGVVVSATDEQDIYVSIVSGLGPVLGAQHLSENGYIFGSSLMLPKSLGSIGSAFVAVSAASRCLKRVISGGVDVRDLLQVVPGLLWGTSDVQTVIEEARARFSAKGPLAEMYHAPSLPFTLPPAPLPYPAINVIEKYADDIVTYADSRSGR